MVSGVRSATSGWLSRLRRLVEPVLVVLTVGALAAGGIGWLAGWRAAAGGCWVHSVAQPLPITDREREIAMLAAAGLSNRQIAERLSIAVRTVDGHLYRMFTKLGIERREQLIDVINVARFRA